MNRHRDRRSATGLLPRMEARPRKDGLVTFRFHPLNPDGSRGKPITLGTDKEAAIRAVLDMNARAKDQGTWGQLWRLYKESPDFARLGDGTKANYEDCWKQLKKVFEFGVVSATKPSDIARYLRVERASAPVVANREVAVLSNLANLAVERGDIERNPCKEVRRNKERPRTRLVESHEFDKFSEWALQQGDSARVLVSMAQFAALTGSRRVEFLTLTWPQVDDQVVRLMRAKQHDGRQKRELITISSGLQEVLNRMREGASALGYVFRAPRTGNPYSQSGFKTMWGRLMDAALAAGVIEERFTFHDLRAHYTTYYKERFGDLPDMHANPATTAAVYERSGRVRRKAL